MENPLDPIPAGEGRPAVILLSGGLDSATCLAAAKAKGYACHAMSFRYGQRHAAELEGARQVARAAGVDEHLIVDLNLRQWGGSALTSDRLSVPKNGVQPGVPVTYVPARNLIFLSLAAARAETLEAPCLFIGVNCLDYSGYPDCRPEFLEAFTRCVNLATKAGVSGRGLSVHAPLLRLNKAQIIRLGVSLGVDYALTRSCYDPAADGAACGRCDSCRLRAKGFRQAGVPDPTKYVE